MVIPESEMKERKSCVMGEQVRAQMLAPNCLGYILCSATPGVPLWANSLLSVV